MPQFNIIAAIPLLVFSVISMAEATGQTVAVADVVGKPLDARVGRAQDHPRRRGRLDIRCDLRDGAHHHERREHRHRARDGRASRAMSRPRAASSCCCSRSSRRSAASSTPFPGSVVGGTAIIVFCIIASMGVDMLRKVDLREHGNLIHVVGRARDGSAAHLHPGPLQQISASGADGHGQWIGGGNLNGGRAQHSLPSSREPGRASARGRARANRSPFCRCAHRSRPSCATIVSSETSAGRRTAAPS